jgi:hypothetical protein
MAQVSIWDYAPGRNDQPTAAPAVPSSPGPQQQSTNPWSGFQWNAGNLGQYDDIMRQANEYQAGGGVERAGTRDTLQEAFNQFYQPKATDYRTAMQSRGTPADATDANLMRDSGFQGFLNNGMLPQQIAASQAGRQPASFNFNNMPGFQFDDPYTKQLEDLVRQNLTAIQQPQANPALDQLTQFLNSRFTELSQSPGYSPEDLALIRTQMLEPIERDRAANRDRVLQRTASRGMLPSSGLHEQDLQEFVDRPAMEARTAAQRDLAINAIGQRRNDLNQALGLGKMAGIDIPGLQRSEDQSRRSEALNLSSLLYDLPNRAMQQANSVIAGSPGPQDLFSQALQLQQSQQQQQAMNAQKWAQIGQLIAGLF